MYLVWPGITLFWSAGTVKPGPLSDAPRTSARSVFTRACIVTALNPKSIAFFVAFVPRFVSGEAALAPQFSILIATFVGFAGLNALIYAVAADAMRERLLHWPSVPAWLARAGGAALVLMGITTALLRRG